MNWRDESINKWAEWIRDRVLGDPSLPLNPGIVERATEIWDAIGAKGYESFQEAREMFEGKPNQEYDRTFKGRCMGVGLRRGEHGTTVDLLTEDDGNWFPSASFSSYWLPEMSDMIVSALAALKSTEAK